jgi:hypothetical protein
MWRLVHNLPVAFLAATGLGKQQYGVISEKFDVVDSSPLDRGIVRQRPAERMERTVPIRFYQYREVPHTFTWRVRK